MLCLRGIKNLPTAAELDFIERYLHVPIGLMLDNTQLLRVKDRGVPEYLLTVEERELRNLMTKARNRVKPFRAVPRPTSSPISPESAIPNFPPRAQLGADTRPVPHRAGTQLQALAVRHLRHRTAPSAADQGSRLPHGAVPVSICAQLSSGGKFRMADSGDRR